MEKDVLFHVRNSNEDNDIYVKLFCTTICSLQVVMQLPFDRGR